MAEVQPSEFPPVRYRGRVWVRVGPRKSIATEAEEKILTERRLSNIHTFDAMPCLGTSIDDLDVSLIRKEFLPKAVAEDVLGEDKRDITDQFASLGLYDLRYNCPTNGAIVLFGKNPERHVHGAYIQMFASRVRIVRVIFSTNISLAVIFVGYCLRLMLLSRQVSHKSVPFP